MSAEMLEKSGAGSRVRTRDPLITNQVLYQLSYTGIGKAFSIALAAAATGFALWSTPSGKAVNYYSPRGAPCALSDAPRARLWRAFTPAAAKPHKFASSRCNPSVSGAFGLEGVAVEAVFTGRNCRVIDGAGEAETHDRDATDTFAGP